MQSSAEKQQNPRLVKVRRDLLDDLTEAVLDLKHAGLGLHLVYVLSHIIPGSELGFDLKKYLILRDPNTGDTIAHISALNDTAVVDPRYDVTAEDIDNLLTSVLNAVYTLIAVCLSYVSHVLSERSDQEWLELGKSMREALLRASGRLVRHNPIILPEISRIVEEFLNKLGVWERVRVVYRVKAPRELKDYIVRRDVYVSADFKTNDERISVDVSTRSCENHFCRKIKLFLDYDIDDLRPPLETTVDAFLREITCGETSCYAEIEAVVDWNGRFAYSLEIVPPPPSMIEKYVSTVTKWWEIASRAIEPKLVFLEQELALITPDDETKLLKFWLTLTKHGEWSVVSVEPA